MTSDGMNFVAQFQQEWRNVSSRVGRMPDALYHYSTAQGLMGIVDSNTVWATNARFLNDNSELEYARDIFLEVVKQYPGTLRSTSETLVNHATREFAERLPKTIDEWSEPDAFVFCLTTSDSDLFQWRAYADNGRGYCVGFDTSKIEAGLRLKPGSKAGAVDFYFRPVIYDGAQQKGLIHYLLYFASIAVAQNQPIESTCTLVGGCWQLLRPFLKHCAFEGEHEWRVVWSGMGGPDRKRFRVRNETVVDYVELNLADGMKAGTKNERERDRESRSHLPIRSITIGPKIDTPASKNTIKELLSAKGHPWWTIEIEFSKLPMR